jgi:hypothetical protein
VINTSVEEGTMVIEQRRQAEIASLQRGGESGERDMREQSQRGRREGGKGNIRSSEWK